MNRYRIGNIISKANVNSYSGSFSQMSKYTIYINGCIKKKVRKGNN